MPGFKIGAQTIVWGEDIRSGMDGILAFLAREGYAGVETGMRHFDAARTDGYKALYAQHALVPLAVHIGGKFWDPAQAAAEKAAMDQAREFAAAVGFRHLVSSGDPAATPASMDVAAREYEAFGARCRQSGVRFAYHNHDWELRDDCAVLERLAHGTSMQNVGLVLDVAWAHRARTDLGRLFERFGERIAYVHVKDCADTTFCELGTGEIDHARVLELAGRYGIEWIVVEQDTTTLAPEQSMRLNRTFLRELGVD
jgi:sugar phosphate isomerase/epimerase